tara:strand:+ start:7040 stop:7705 length:666 start_codon:yes stop_codon:yes gene_type:complete
MPDILMIIAPEGFRDEEYFYVREELERSGNKITVASTKDVAVSSVEKKEVVVDLLLEECDVADYDAVIFSGGPGTKIYFDNQKALEICYQTIEQGKILAAICMAPGILARAGVLEGKNATAWESEKEVLNKAGAITSDSHVVIDGQIITADGPDSAREFAKKVDESLKLNVEKDEDEEEEYYKSEDEEKDDEDEQDEGFPENKPYYDEDGRVYEKRDNSKE